MNLFDEMEAVRAGEATAEEITRRALERIEGLQPELNAFCQLDADGALGDARAIDVARAAGHELGPLAGVPIGVKDLEDAAGFTTVYGDPVHKDDPRATRDSVHVARYRAAGAVILGKTNTPAHGFTAETDNLVFGPSRNPWAPGRTPGGSSGGTAAALASGMVTLATGSDGGGSIRIPSEACGLSGFKPTHGVIPNGDDEPPTWSTFSTRGPMARTFSEIAYALDVVKGYSARDMLSFDLAGSFVEAAERATVAGLRVAWSPTLGVTAEPDAQVLACCIEAVKALAAAGADVEEVEVVFHEPPIEAWMPVAARGSYLKLNQHDMDWSERFLPSATLLAAAGRRTDADAIIDALGRMHRAGLDLANLFDRFDLLVTPGMVGPPPRVREDSAYGPTWAADFTLPFNLTRTPAAVVPAGFVVDDGDELPVGLQLVGPRCSDLRVMQAAAATEQILGFVHRRPPIHAAP